MLKNHGSNLVTENSNHKKSGFLKTCKTKGGEVVEINLKEADVPLVGCFANDTENRFTAGIDSHSEEIKRCTDVTVSPSAPGNLGFLCVCSREVYVTVMSLFVTICFCRGEAKKGQEQ